MATFELRERRTRHEHGATLTKHVAIQIRAPSSPRTVRLLDDKQKLQAEKPVAVFLNELEETRTTWTNKALFQPAFPEKRETEQILAQFQDYLALVRTNQAGSEESAVSAFPFELIPTLDALSAAVAMLEEDNPIANEAAYADIKVTMDLFVLRTRERLSMLESEEQRFTLTEMKRFEEALQFIEEMPTVDAFRDTVDPDKNWNELLDGISKEREFTEDLHRNADLEGDILPHLFQTYYLPGLARLVDLHPDEDFPTDTLLSLEFLAGSTARVHRLFARVRDDDDLAPGLRLAYQTLLERKERVFAGDNLTNSAREEKERLAVLLAEVELSESEQRDDKNGADTVFGRAIEAGRVQMLERLRILVDALNDEEKRGNREVNDATHTHARFIAQRNPELLEVFMLTAITRFLTPYCVAFKLAGIERDEQLKAFKLLLGHMATGLLQFEVPLNFPDFLDDVKQEAWFDALVTILTANEETLREAADSATTGGERKQVTDLRTVLPQEVQTELDALILMRVAPAGGLTSLATTLLDGLSQTLTVESLGGIVRSIPDAFVAVLGDVVSALDTHRVALGLGAALGFYFIARRGFGASVRTAATAATVGAVGVSVAGVWWQMPFLGRRDLLPFDELGTVEVPFFLFEVVQGYAAGVFTQLAYFLALTAAEDRVVFAIPHILPALMAVLARMDAFMFEPSRGTEARRRRNRINLRRQLVFQGKIQTIVDTFIPELNGMFGLRVFGRSASGLVQFLWTISGKVAKLAAKLILTPLGFVSGVKALLRGASGLMLSSGFQTFFFKKFLAEIRSAVFVLIAKLGPVGDTIFAFGRYLASYLANTHPLFQLVTFILLAQGIIDVVVNYREGNRHSALIRTAGVVLQFALSSYVFQKEDNGATLRFTDTFGRTHDAGAIANPFVANAAVFALLAGTSAFLYYGRLNRR